MLQKNNIRSPTILELLGIEFQKISDNGFLVVRKGDITMFNEKNKGAIDWNYKTENEDIFLSTKDFYKVTNDIDYERFYRVHGFFFFDTQYGDSGALITSKCYIYIPKHAVEIFKGFTEEEINAVKQGCLGISLHTYKSHGRNCVGINLEDIEGDKTVYDEWDFDIKLARALSTDEN